MAKYVISSINALNLENPSLFLELQSNSKTIKLIALLLRDWIGMLDFFILNLLVMALPAICS